VAFQSISASVAEKTVREETGVGSIDNVTDWAPVRLVSVLLTEVELDMLL